MFVDSENVVGSAGAGPIGVRSVADTVRLWTRLLRHAPGNVADDAERVDLLRALEELTCAAAGAQVVTTADFDASQRAEQAAAGVPPERQGRGVASQVALARRESTHRGQRTWASRWCSPARCRTRLPCSGPDWSPSTARP